MDLRIAPYENLTFGVLHLANTPYKIIKGGVSVAILFSSNWIPPCRSAGQAQVALRLYDMTKKTKGGQLGCPRFIT